MPQYLTTGDCSRITGLSQQTIIRAIDKGLLVGFRVPGSKHRRVTKESLKSFAELNGMPEAVILLLTERESSNE
jgi:two-component system OmpR family response regulator